MRCERHRSADEKAAGDFSWGGFLQFLLGSEFPRARFAAETRQSRVARPRAKQGCFAAAETQGSARVFLSPLLPSPALRYRQRNWSFGCLPEHIRRERAAPAGRPPSTQACDGVFFVGTWTRILKAFILLRSYVANTMRPVGVRKPYDVSIARSHRKRDFRNENDGNAKALFLAGK